MRKLIDFILWFLWFPVGRFLVSIPPRVLNKILGFASYVFYRCDSARRKGVAEEIRMLYGSRFSANEIRKITRNSFDIYLKRLFENFYFGKIDKQYCDKIAYVDGIEHLETALKKGKGALLMQFHFGSFLMVLPAVGFNGITINGLAGVPLTESSYLKKKLIEFRAREQTSYPFKQLIVKSSLLPVAKALSRNEAVAMTLDGRQGANLVPVRLIERTALFSPGIFTLCLRRGTPILPLAIIRSPEGRHRILIEPEMQMTAAGDEEATAKLNLANFIHHYERYLLDYPDHYAMTLYSLRNEVKQGLNQPMFRDD